MRLHLLLLLLLMVVLLRGVARRALARSAAAAAAWLGLWLTACCRWPTCVPGAWPMAETPPRPGRFSDFASPEGTCRDRRCFAEFQWFFTALSVRPSSSLAISAQRLPY